jgi:hypothetical protein
VSIHYYFAPNTNPSHTFSITNTGNNPSLAVLAFSGASASPLDQSAGNGTTTNTNQAVLAAPVASPITPTTSGQLIVSGECGVFSITGLAIDSGFTLRDYIAAGSFISVASAYFVQATAATINPNWTWVGADSAQACIASFKGSGWTLVDHTAAQTTDGNTVTTSPINTAGAVTPTAPFIPGRRRSPHLIRRKLYVKTG